jgi:hypothetical protein
MNNAAMPSNSRAPTTTPTPIPALAPVLRPLFWEEGCRSYFRVKYLSRMTVSNALAVAVTLGGEGEGYGWGGETWGSGP